MTTDLTSVTSTLSAPGCNSFLSTNVNGFEQANGKIGFAIDTSTLQAGCQIRVYAELEMFPTLFEFSDIRVIEVACGLETISLDSSLTQPEQLIYSKNEPLVLSPFTLNTHHSPPYAAIFSSN